MDIVVTNLQAISVDPAFVRDVLARALRACGYRTPPDVGVALVDDAYIRVLNRDYRGSDYATDVLSFRLDEDGAARPTGGQVEAVLGDIVISIERAREQARQYRHSFRREVALLAIHGLLHLLGYDDETEAAASVMSAKQTELLQTVLGRGRARPAQRGSDTPRGAGTGRAPRSGTRA